MTYFQTKSYTQVFLLRHMFASRADDLSDQPSYFKSH